MKKIVLFLSLTCYSVAQAQTEHLLYHDIKTDANGNIVPWYSNNPGKAWSHVIQLVWNFWDSMRTDMNGLPYYMNHQVWNGTADDPRGIGGDQFNMALSSWGLLYAYTGNERIKENMKFLADYYLTHSLSPDNAAWPDIPYPYNTLVYSGMYDGDMILGKDYTQPDKAGSFGIELVHLFKMTNGEWYPNITDDRYLDAAIKIANTLAAHTTNGDENNSPLPFKVNAITGEVGKLKNNNHDGKVVGLSSYTTNWSATLELFLELQQLHAGNTMLYKQAFDKILGWMKKYPLQNNKWGPFFEDVPGWSDTQINAVTFAQFIMHHTEYFPNWQQQVKEIFEWVYQKLGNKNWNKYGVTVVNEQTAYLQPGNSHTSREGSAELQYAALTGDTTYVTNAVRQLNWATYMVDVDGKNRYPNDDNWLTDGYGDYVRHFLRAMAAMPKLAPKDEDHLLSSSSVVQHINYGNKIHYATFDTSGTEIFRLTAKPADVLFDDKDAKDLDEKFQWKELDNGGILTVIRAHSTHITLIK